MGLPSFAQRVRVVAVVGWLCGVGCAGGEVDGASTPMAAPAVCVSGDDALSTCLTPKQPASYYVEQSLRYFDTLDASVSPQVHPAYSDLVARWEWPPWLKLTGYGKQMMIDTAALVVTRDPSTLPQKECRAFAVQPFGRCHVTFQYAGGTCPIYEEFTFNDQGEMTFIEAWTDLPGRLPMDAASDPWAEGPAVKRLSTRIPGLGSGTGRIDPSGVAMTRAAAADPEVADFTERANDFWGTWFKEVASNGKDIYPRGCGW